MIYSDGEMLKYAYYIRLFYLCALLGSNFEETFGSALNAKKRVFFILYLSFEKGACLIFG
jgi:hypothetical protein